MPKKPLYPHVPKSRIPTPGNPFRRIKTTETVAYPDTHLVYSGDAVIGRYHFKLNKLELEVEYADKFPEILKAIGAVHGREALNKIGNNIEWVGVVFSPERERYLF